MDHRREPLIFLKLQSPLPSGTVFQCGKQRAFAFLFLVGVELLPQRIKQLVHTAQLTVQEQPAQQAFEAGGSTVFLRGSMLCHTGFAGVAAPFEHGQLVLGEQRFQQLLLPELCPGRDVLDLSALSLPAERR